MPWTTYRLEELRRRLTDRWEGVPFWTREDATDAINETLMLWNALTGAWKRQVTLPTVAGQVTYALPSTILYRMRVQYGVVPMHNTCHFDLDNGRPSWRMETTASGGDVPTRPLLWVPVSLTEIDIWPADAVGAGVLTIDGVAATPTVVYDTDTVDTSEATLDVLLGCAVHLAAFKEGSERFLATRPLFADFLAAASRENSHLKASSWYRRFLGLDDEYAFVPTRSGPTAYDRIAQAVAGGN